YSMIKRRNEVTLKESIGEWLDSYLLREKLNARLLEQNWEKLFGKIIAKHTKKISVSHKKLFLTVESAPLRQELFYSREKMMARINEAIEADFIREIIIH